MKVLVLKTFAYEKDGNKITVKKQNKLDVNSKPVYHDLTGENLKYFKKCKAVEVVE